MKKIFISADIEGTAGVAVVDETDPGNKTEYAYFAEQMSREVAAACEGAQSAGVSEILVKDAHWNARNIIPHLLPEHTLLNRGWSGHPFKMMDGLDESFDGVFLTGYHSGAGTDTLPLSHTITGGVNCIIINGYKASELYINTLTASSAGVPVLLVSGDMGVCEEAKRLIPGVQTVPTLKGCGGSITSLHPSLICNRIRLAAKNSVMDFKAGNGFIEVPQKFDIEVEFKDHSKSYRGSFYPGAEKTGPRTLSFSCEKWMDALSFLLFVL